MPSASIVERVWFRLTLTNKSLRCTILAISRAMNNSADSDSPDTDHACVVGVGVAASSSSSSVTRTRNPRKKRTKLITIMDDHSVAVKAKPYKRPDPDAPKITRPCTECGKQFWSWKALFGHMRCHPERQWRGINPPPNLRRQQQPPQTEQQVQVRDTTQEDHEVAACLLLLASGRERFNEYGSGTGTLHVEVDKDVECGSQEQQQERFECSSCKKVFGSHQALGGHRASHKNVKGCFAITRTDGDHASPSSAPDDDRININMNMMTMIHGGAGASTAVDDGGGHKCSICFRVFSTGQALGGHKRCHWEKADTDPSIAAPASAPREGCVPVDLNLPASPEDRCSSSPLTLDLRLGL